MSVFEFQCPTCGKILETESTTKTMYCPYCEEKINVLKAIEDQKIELENEKISYFTKIENYKDAGDEAFENGEYKEAIENYLKCLELDKDNDYLIKSIVKAANYAIEKHYKTFESTYIESSQHIDKMGLNDEIQDFLEARDIALSMLDPRVIIPEMMITPTEQKIEIELKKKRKRYLLIRFISIFLSVAILAIAIALSFIF